MTATDHALVLSEDAQDLLFREARTANAFADEPVSDEQMRAVYDLVRWGPSSANGQPLRVLLVRSADARARLVPLMGGSNQAKTEKAPLTAILAYDPDFHEHLPRLMPHMPTMRSWFEGSPQADDQRAATAHESAAIQAGYLILGVRAAGLAAGPMGGFDRAAVDAAFFSGERLRSFLVVNVGRPAAEGAWHDRSPRLDYDEVFRSV